MARQAAVLYVVIVLALTLLPVFGLDSDKPVRVDMTLFGSLSRAVAHGVLLPYFAFLLGNLALFAPVGVLVPRVLGRSSAVLVFLTALVFSTAIELTQLAVDLFVGFEYRTPSLDDVIVNVTGAIVGYAVFGALVRTPRRRPPNTVV
ncbi:MAG: VanZ family protein [Candidatus Limnocylindrales bacterium]